MRVLIWLAFAATVLLVALQGVMLAAASTPLLSYDVRVDQPFGVPGARRVVRAERRGALERGAAREQFVEHRAEAEDIGPPVQGLPLHLLRRHIRRGADDRTFRRPGHVVVRDELRNAEVEQLRTSVRRDQDVRRFQVPMHQILAVQ